MADTSLLALGAGYALAAPFSVWPAGFQRLWRRREPAVIAAELTGTALIAAGWAMRGRTAAVVPNAMWGVGLGAALLLTRGRARATKQRV